MRAGTGYIPVSQEATGLFVIILAGGFLNEFPLVIQFAEKLRSGFIVNLVRCAGVDVKGDTEVGKSLLVQLMVAVNHLLRSDSLLAGFQGDGYSMLVGAAD